MKTLNRFIFLFLFSFIAIGLFSDLTVSAQNTTSKPSTVISEEDSSVYSGDVIVWKYKTMNGKLYKRKYNQTTKKWIGKWIQAEKRKASRFNCSANLSFFLLISA